MKAVVRVDCMPREQRTAIRRACRDEIINHNRRMLKLACVVLHKEFGFGYNRLFRFIEKMSDLSSSRMDDPVFWQHNDKLLIKELGMAWDEENYEEMGE